MIGIIVFSAILLLVVLVVVAYLTWLERKFAGRIQSRIGPYWVGRPHGWLQPLADGIKIFLKEDIIPRKADKWVFNFAPVIVLLTAFLVFATIPFTQKLVLSDLNIGVLYFLAVSSLAVIGIFMAGYGSNNKYAILSAMRLGAQLVSYEIPLVLSMLVPVILSGSMKMGTIVNAQKSLWFIAYFPVGTIAFIIFLLAALAEDNRIPFDIPEAESELVAGFNIEYSGIKFAFFYLSEYTHLLAMSALGAVLFFGGYRGPLLPPLLWFFIKTILLFLFILWIRWSYLRLRIDQMMKLNWKILVPVSLANLALAGIFVLYLIPKGSL